MTGPFTLTRAGACAALELVPPAAAVEPSLRRVPARTFLPDGSPGLLASADHDEVAISLIIFETDDTPVDLLGVVGRRGRHCCRERPPTACPPPPSATPSRWRGPDGCCAGSRPRPVSRT